MAGLGGFLGNLNQGLQQMDPMQRAGLLRMAAANTRSPMAARGLATQADDYINISEQAKINAQRQKEFDTEMDFRREQFGMERQERADRQARSDAFRTDMQKWLTAKTPEDRQSILSGSTSPEFLEYVGNQKPGKIDPVIGRIIAAGYVPGTPGFEKAMDRYLFNNPSSQVNVNVNPEGNQPPTSSVQTQLQKNILEAERSLRELNKIQDTYSDEFMTTAGRLKAMVGSWADQIGQDPFGLATFNAERGKFASNTKQFFNQYRKEITGAAASEKELEQLVEALFSDDLGPLEFQSRFDEFITKSMMNLDANRQAARSGINVGGEDAPAEASNVVDWNSL